jgi:indolepyruvate ferredoxin oxidoreductase alpha subunit
MVIVVGDDPNCWSSAQTEENSRAYSLMAHLPTLEPADAQECRDFTKLAFEISEKFNIPVMIRTTIRVAHQRGAVEFQEVKKNNKAVKVGEFVKNYHQYVTLPPRVLEMKRELLEKTEKIRKYFEKLKINKPAGNKGKIGVVASGVGYSHFMEAESQMQLDLPVLKLGTFYPLPEENIKKFLKGLKKVLVVEELEPYIEREIKIIAKEENLKVEIIGKKLLPEIGELNIEKIGLALSKLTGKKFVVQKSKILNLPRRTSRLCEGCPHLYTFSAIKRAAPEGTIFGGDIGCYMMAGLAPHNIQDYLFCMGSSIGIAHGIKKSTKQKVISLIGDGTFFHSGISGLINAIYNRSNPLMIILDNRITAMTGHQQNPGMGKSGMLDPAPELNIEEIVKSLGVKYVKTLDQINMQELENTIKEFLEKEEVSVIICKRICALLDRRQKNK